MAARMGKDEVYFRVPVRIHYEITYHGDTVPTPIDEEYYLGPYGSAQMARTQAKIWRKRYESKPSIYKDLQLYIGDVEIPEWRPI